MPKVSVVLPVYNTEKYLPSCLNSLVQQTLKDIEIICVNDGSTDNCASILSSYAEKDSRIKIIQQENSGVAMARNAGIKHACGDYIAFVDSDDWVDVDFLEKLLGAILTGNFDFAKANIYFQKKNFKEYTKNRNNRIRTGLKDGKPIQTLLSSQFSTILYKRSVIKEHHIYFENIRSGEDSLFVLNYLKFAGNGNIIDNTFYHYRYVENSASKIIMEQDVFDAFIRAKKIMEYVKHLSNENQNTFYTTNLDHLVAFYPYVLSEFSNIKDEYYSRLIAYLKSNKLGLIPIYDDEKKTQAAIHDYAVKRRKRDVCIGNRVLTRIRGDHPILVALIKKIPFCSIQGEKSC